MLLNEHRERRQISEKWHCLNRSLIALCCKYSLPTPTALYISGHAHAPPPPTNMALHALPLEAASTSLQSLLMPTGDWLAYHTWV